MFRVRRQRHCFAERLLRGAIRAATYRSHARCPARRRDARHGLGCSLGDWVSRRSRAGILLDEPYTAQRLGYAADLFAPTGRDQAIDPLFDVGRRIGATSSCHERDVSLPCMALLRTVNQWVAG